MRRAAGRGGLLFDLKNHIHDRIGKIGFCGRAEAREIWFGSQPAGLQSWEAEMQLDWQRPLRSIAGICWAHAVRRSSAWAKAAVMRRLRSASEM